MSYTPPTCDPHGSPIALRSACNAAPLGPGNHPAMRRRRRTSHAISFWRRRRASHAISFWRQVVLTGQPLLSLQVVSNYGISPVSLAHSSLFLQICGLMAFGDPHPHFEMKNVARPRVDVQHDGSFKHSAKLLSCPWGRDPWGTRNISFVSRPYSLNFLPTSLYDICDGEVFKMKHTSCAV